MSTVSTNSPPPNVHIAPLPRSHPNPSTFSALISKTKSLRLSALLAHPRAFASTHERESAFPDSVWEDRARNPLATTFVAIDANDAAGTALPGSNGSVDSSPPTTPLITAPWLGTAVLVGPLDRDATDPTSSPWKSIAVSPASRPPSSAHTQAPPAAAHPRADVVASPHFMINALYVAPGHTRRGIGGALLRAAVEHGVALARESPPSLVHGGGGGGSGEGEGGEARVVRFSTIADEGNGAARRLYRRVGFVEGERVVFVRRLEEGEQGAVVMRMVMGM